MHIDTLIAEIRAGWSKYDSQGLIDTDSCYRWAKNALKLFGVNIMEVSETILYISNGKATLPDGFFSLEDAVMISPDYYCSKGDSTALVDSFMWKERTIRGNTWNSCDSCCGEISSNEYVEKIYINTSLDSIDFHYSNPIRLSLGKHINRDSISKSCKNLHVHGSPYTVTINNQTLYTNFSDGIIFLKYHGIPEDDKGRPIIPETPKGHVESFIEYHLKKKILEDIIINSDDTSISNIFSYIVGEEANQKELALTDAKFSKISPKSFSRLRNLNRLDSLKYEIVFPSF